MGPISDAAEILSETGLECMWHWLRDVVQEGRGFFLCLFIISAFFVFAIVFWWRRRVEPEKPEETPKPTTADDDKSVSVDKCECEDRERRSMSPGVYRFRKRDKAIYTAKMLMRKMKSLGSSAGNGAGRRRASVMKFAAQWLSKTKEKQAMRSMHGPPSTFFEPDIGTEDTGALPPEVFYMLKNIRVFGHFETPCFLELCRHVTEISVPDGQYLFRPGDADDSIYVVQTGKMAVYIRDNDVEYEVKKVGRGESILSLLSILDVLSGHSAPFKTVSAKACVDSTILKLSGMAFNEIFERYPESWVRAIQIIALRLQRVTFTTLRHYLGMSLELTKPTLRDGGSKRTRAPSGTTEASKMPSGRSQSFSSRAFHNVFGPGRSAPPTPDAPSDPTHDTVSPAIAATSTAIVAAAAAAEPATVPAPADALAPTTAAAPAPAPAAAPAPEPSSTGAQLPPTGRPHGHPVDEEHLKKLAKTQLIEVLGLSDDPQLLEGKITVGTFPAGYTLTEQGSTSADLIYLITGALEMLQRAPDDGKPSISGIVHSHELVGGLAVLTGEPSFYTIKTRLQSRVAIISKDSFLQIIGIKPRVVLNVAHTVVMRLSPFIRSIDFALDWEMCDAGKALYNQNDPSDCLYVVLSGRLRSVVKKSDTEKHVLSEYGRGDLVGLVEVLTSLPRATTVISVRYTELAKLPSGLLTYIKMRHPQVVTRIIHLLGHCILGQQEDKLTPAYGMPYSIGSASRVANFNTIAVAAVADDVPLGPFALELLHALKSITPTLLLSRDIIERDLGVTALNPVNEYHLLSWLSRQEDAYPMVLYQCDYTLTPWTWRCIRQADCVIIVANGNTTPTAGPLIEIVNGGVRARKNLVLLWPDETERPVNTQGWLEASGYVNSYYHIRAPHRMYVCARKDHRKMREYYEKIAAKHITDPLSDFCRLARMLTGRAIGLVLGGGGARGASHLGILRALKEHRVPIDFVGGVSIGSFVGGLYCSDPDIGRVTQRAREWFMDMAPFSRYVLELTYPYSAMFTGSGFNSLLQKTLGDRLIEDLWIPYFNVTTDITASRMRVHRSGQLWRYCRASMSLAGYYPPICNPSDGHQLLDGGYVNNVPADVMRDMGVSKIVAVDVGSQDETDLTNYGDSLNGFWVLFQRFNPWAAPLRVLNMAEIQSRLAYVSCVRQLEEVKKAPYCYYIRPPIDKYQTLDFGLFDEICNVGLQHGKAVLHEWITKGKLADLLQGTAQEACNEDRYKDTLCHTAHSPQSFTDLAAYVSKIEHPRNPWHVLSDVSDDEIEEIDVHEDFPKSEN